MIIARYLKTSLQWTTQRVSFDPAAGTCLSYESDARPLDTPPPPYAGPAAWNQLPESIRQLQTTSFKHKLKTFLFTQCYNSAD